MAPIRNMNEFKDLYDLRFNHLVLFSMQMGLPFQESKDIVQDCFIRFWELRDRVDNPTSYLFRAVRNHTANELQKSSRRRGTSLESLRDMPPDSFDYAASLEHFHKVEAAYERLLQLSGRMLDVFVMVYLEKRKIKEVGEELDISENTVKTYLKRAKAALLGTLVLVIWGMLGYVSLS